jgi:hypothetical protein
LLLISINYSFVTFSVTNHRRVGKLVSRVVAAATLPLINQMHDDLEHGNIIVGDQRTMSSSSKAKPPSLTRLATDLSWIYAQPA